MTREVADKDYYLDLNVAADDVHETVTVRYSEYGHGDPTKEIRLYPLTADSLHVEHRCKVDEYGVHLRTIHIDIVVKVRVDP